MISRIKKIRKDADVTQVEFAQVLGLSRSMISQVEAGMQIFSDRSIRDICRIYNVNEEWLRTGIGEPYVPRTRNEEIADFLNSIMEDEPDSIRRIFIETFSKLPYEAWVVLDQLAEEYVKNKKD